MNNPSAETFEQLVDILMSGNEWAGYEAAQKLAQFDSSLSIPVFVRALRHVNDRVQSIGAQGLSLVGDKAINPLIEIIKDKDAVLSSRHIATGVLGGLSEAAVLPAIELLSSEDATVRRMAVFPLGRLEDLRALDPLINTLKFDPDAEARAGAVYSLSTLKDAKAFEPLIAALKDPDRDVRFRVVGALGRLGHAGLRDAGAIKPLMDFIEQVEDNDLNLKTSAISALGDLQDNQSFELLLNLIQDENNHDWIRETAIVAIGHLKNKQAVEVLIHLLSDERFRLDIAAALGRIGDKRAVKPLIECLNDPHMDTRLTVVWSLGLIGDKTALSALHHVEQTDMSEDSDGDKISVAASRAIELIHNHSSHK